METMNVTFDLLFKAMYDDYIGGQPSTALRTVMAAQAPQVLHTPMTSTIIANTAPTPTNTSSQATNIPTTSQDVDELEKQQQQHNHFFKGTIDPTLFIRRFNDDILVVQVYVDDIIFGSTNPRPDIVYATCLCDRFQAKPTEKYLKEMLITGCKYTFKSTSGGTQFLGEKLVGWSLKKQDCTMLSTVKAEYVSLSTCCAKSFGCEHS
nr:hypothetical protein [Tanacetum cinerariifolium]